MNTTQFVNFIQRNVDADGLSFEDILFITNQAISLLVHAPNAENIIFDEATGRLPLLETTTQVFRYNAPDAFWKVNGVYIEYDKAGKSFLNNIIPTTDYGSYTRTQRIKIQKEEIAGITYIKVPYIRSYQRGDTSSAYIIFTEDPQTTTDTYRWYASKNPEELLSNSTTLPIFPPYDMKYLFPVTIELIRGTKNGKMPEAIEYAERQEKKYSRDLNKGEQGEDSDATDRGF